VSTRISHFKFSEEELECLRQACRESLHREGMYFNGIREKGSPDMRIEVDGIISKPLDCEDIDYIGSFFIDCNFILIKEDFENKNRPKV